MINEDATELAIGSKAWVNYYIKNAEQISRYADCPLTEYQIIMIDVMSERIDALLAMQERVAIWSAGCGIDRISLELKKKYLDRIEVTMQDISAECMAVNKCMFDAAGMEARMLPEDLFGCQTAPEYDLVMNTGLLEHFTPSEQMRLSEVFRGSLRPGGLYITLTPYARGLIYNHCRKILMRNGQWDCGPEDPIYTLKHWQNVGWRIVSERPIDGLGQLNFIRPAYPRVWNILSPFIYVVRKQSRISEPLIRKMLGGYCILDILEKQ